MKCWPACARRISVDVVSHDRPSHLGAMHAQLMGTSGYRLECEPGQPGPAAHHLPGAYRRQPPAVCLHPPAARLVALGERNIDAAFVRIGTTFGDRPITFANLALLKKLAKQ